MSFAKIAIYDLFKQVHYVKTGGLLLLLEENNRCYWKKTMSDFQ